MSLSSSCSTCSCSVCLAETASRCSPEAALAQAPNRMTQRLGGGGNEEGWHEAFGAHLIALEKKLHPEEIPMLYFLSRLPHPLTLWLKYLPDSNRLYFKWEIKSSFL